MLRLEIYNRMTQERLEVTEGTQPVITLAPGESWSRDTASAVTLAICARTQSGGHTRTQGQVRVDPLQGVWVDRGACEWGAETITLGVTYPGGQYLQTHGTGGAWIVTREVLARGGTVSVNYRASV